MQRRELGPLPLTGGLYLDRARAPGNTLSDVLNMEAESGEVRTRGGLSLRAALSLPAGSTTASAGTTETANGEYIEIFVPTAQGVGNGPKAGQLVVMELGGTNTEEIWRDEWWVEDEDNNWVRVHMINPDAEFSGDLDPIGSGSKLFFVMPTNPRINYLGQWALWVRVKPTHTPAGTWAPTFTNDASSSELNLNACGKMRSFVTRSGPKTVVIAAESTSYKLYDVGTANGTNVPSTAALSGVTANGDTVTDSDMLYIPATDELLVRVDDSFFVHDCAQWIDGGLSSWSPDTEAELVDTAYEDIPLRTALRRHKDMVLFEGSVFMLGSDDDPATIVWSAPAEFWKVWPEDNEYTLSSSGAGRIVGAEVINRTLYVFTDTQIWSANMAEPPSGRSEDTVVFSLVEETGCTSKDSIVAAESGIFFLAGDGIRMFDGQRSFVVSSPVSSLFERQTENPYAVRYKSTAFGVWDSNRRQYLLFYEMFREGDPGGAYSAPSKVRSCNACVVIDIKDKSAWLWSGEDRPASLNARSTSAVDGWFQSNILFRAASATFNTANNAVTGITRDGFIFDFGSDTTDTGFPFGWRLETQHIGLGKSRRQCLVQADVEVPKETYKSMDVAAIPDGRTDRASTRTVTPQKDGVGDVLGVADSAGEALVEASNAYGPAIARFRSQGRNHRIKVSGEGGGVRIASVTAHVIETSRR